MEAYYALTRAEYERELDAAIAGSFPASDPPPWTLGASAWMDLKGAARPVPTPAAIDVVFEDGRRLGGIRLASIGEAMAMMAMVPLAILIVWGIANAVSWLTGSS
jgi:hypothetical protein